MANETAEQPTADSGKAPIEDRVASIFDGTSQPAPETDAEPRAAEEVTEEAASLEEYFEYDYEGERYHLPKKLEKAVMQERDYTQKSQRLADQVRQAELRDQQLRIAGYEQEFQQGVAEITRKLAMFDEALEQAKATPWATMSTDEVIRRKLELDQWKEQREALSRQVESKRQEWRQKFEADMQKYRTDSMDALRKRVPAWSDDIAKEVRAHALGNYGLSEAEVNSIIDPRHAEILYHAYLYAQAQKKAGEAVKKVNAPIKSSSSTPMPQQVKDRLNYRKAMQKAAPGSQERKALVQDRIAKIFGAN